MERLGYNASWGLHADGEWRRWRLFNGVIHRSENKTILIKFKGEREKRIKRSRKLKKREVKQVWEMKDGCSASFEVKDYKVGSKSELGDFAMRGTKK